MTKIIKTLDIIAAKNFMLKSVTVQDWNARRDEVKLIIAKEYNQNVQAVKEILYHIDARKWIKELNFPKKIKKLEYE